MKIILCLVLLSSCAAPFDKEKYIEVDYPTGSIYYPTLKGSKIIKSHNGRYYIPKNKIETL